MRHAIARLTAHLRTPLYLTGYALMLNQGLNAALGVAFWILAARLYPAEAVGRNAAVISTLVFIAFFSHLGLRNAMTWALPGSGAAARPFILRAYLLATLAALAAAPSVLFLLGTGERTADVFRTDPGFVTWFVLAAVLSCLFTLQDGVLIGLRAPTWVPIENAIFGVLKIALVVAFFALIPELGIFAAWTLVVPPVVIAVNLLIFRRLLPRHAAANTDRAEPIRLRDVLRFVSGDHTGALLAEGAVRLIPILVVVTLGSAANAYSYQAWTLALPLYMLAGNMATSLTVESMANRERRADYSRRMLTHMARLLIPISLGVFLLGPLVLVLFGREYAREASDLVRFLALAAIPVTLNAWYYSMCRIRRRVRGIVLNQALLAIVAIALSAVLLPVLGITASGIAWLVGQSLVAVIVAFVEFRRPLLDRALRVAADAG